MVRIVITKSSYLSCRVVSWTYDDDDDHDDDDDDYDDDDDVYCTCWITISSLTSSFTSVVIT